jgi:hypothetical protein
LLIYQLGLPTFIGFAGGGSFDVDGSASDSKESLNQGRLQRKGIGESLKRILFWDTIANEASSVPNKKGNRSILVWFKHFGHYKTNGHYSYS